MQLTGLSLRFAQSCSHCAAIAALIQAGFQDPALLTATSTAGKGLMPRQAGQVAYARPQSKASMQAAFTGRHSSISHSQANMTQSFTSVCLLKRKALPPGSPSFCCST